MTVKTDFKYVGTRPIRPDGLDKVTGRAKYGADLNVQGMIYGHIVRWKDEPRLREVMRILEAEGVYIADPHTWVVEDGGKKSINPHHVELKMAMDPAGLLNPGKLRAWAERDGTQKKSVFWDS